MSDDNKNGPRNLILVLLIMVLLVLMIVAVQIFQLIDGVPVSHSRHYTDTHNLVREEADMLSYYSDHFTVHQCERTINKSPGSLPNFIVAGVHKGGSTAIFGYLASHGHIRPSSCKETNFFTDEKIFRKGINYYRRHFPDLSELRYHHMITGEGTPNYIRNPRAPMRIRKEIPEVKIIITLRNPVNRFVSHYVGAVENKRFEGTCTAFLQEELKELEKCAGMLKKQPNETTSERTALDLIDCQGDTESCLKQKCLGYNHELALSRGVYFNQVQRWLHYFPSSQIKIVQAEQLYADTNNIMQSIATFLGIRHYTEEELTSFQKTYRGSNHMSNPIENTCNKITLQEFYHGYNLLFYELLRKTFPHDAKKWQSW